MLGYSGSSRSGIPLSDDLPRPSRSRTRASGVRRVHVLRGYEPRRTATRILNRFGWISNPRSGVRLGTRGSPSSRDEPRRPATLNACAATALVGSLGKPHRMGAFRTRASGVRFWGNRFGMRRGRGRGCPLRADFKPVAAEYDWDFKPAACGVRDWDLQTRGSGV